MKGTKKVILNSSFYVVSSLLVDAIGFVLLPVYLVFLDPNEYGVVSIANGFLDVIILVAVMSLHMAVARFYTDYKKNNNDVSNYFGSLLNFTWIASLVFTLLLLLFKGMLERYIFEGIPFNPIIILILVSIPFRSIRNIHRAILRGTQEGGELALANLSAFIIQAGLTLLFIGYYKLGAAGMLLAALITHGLYVIYVYIDLLYKKMLSFSLKWKMITDSLKYSIPILPHNLSSYIATLFGRVVLNNTYDTTTVGLYSVASQFGTVVDTIEASTNNAFTPWFFNYKNGDEAQSPQNLVKIFACFFALILLTVGLFSQEIILLFTNISYHEAWKAIPVLNCAFAIKAVYYFYMNVLLFYKEAAKKLFTITLSGSFLNIFITALLTRHFGMYGPAIGLVVSQFFISSLIFFYSRKFDKTSLNYHFVLTPILLSFFLLTIGIAPSYFYFENEVVPANIVIKSVILLFFVVFILKYNRDITSVIRQMIKKKIKIAQR